MLVLLHGVGVTRDKAASQQPRLVERHPRATEEQPVVLLVVAAPTGEATTIVGVRWPHRLRVQPTIPAAVDLPGVGELSGRMHPVPSGGVQLTRWSGQQERRRRGKTCEG